MQAVTVNDLTAEVFADVLRTGAKEVLGTGCIVLPEKDYARMLEDFEDMEIEREAARRLKEPEGKGITLEELMARHGITQAEIDAIPEEDAE